jgi:hypothetical protein
MAATAVATAPAQVVVQSYSSLEYEYADDSNNVWIMAGPLLTGGLYAPTFWHQFDVDYYHISVTAVPSTLTVLVDGVDSLFGGCDPEAWIEDSAGNRLIYHDDIAYPANTDAYLSYVFTVPGDYYVATQLAGLWSYNFSNYTMSGTYSYLEVDEEAPTYSGEEGVKEALRLVADQYRSAYVSWHEATDNVTPSSQIQYNIYYATTPQAVFSGSPDATFTGVLGATISGLSSDPDTDYWFGVRAEDASGNEDTNNRVVLAQVPLAVPAAQWMLYR